jgi:hypothetical protein
MNREHNQPLERYITLKNNKIKQKITGGRVSKYWRTQRRQMRLDFLSFLVEKSSDGDPVLQWLVGIRQIFNFRFSWLISLLRSTRNAATS